MLGLKVMRYGENIISVWCWLYCSRKSMDFEVLVCQVVSNKFSLLSHS